MEDITLTINGKRVSCPPGTSILEAAEEQGIKIPKLCYHPDLEPFGACRLCLVEDEKNGRVMASCVTPVAPDMSIKTDSPRIIKNRIKIENITDCMHIGGADSAYQKVMAIIYIARFLMKYSNAINP